MRLARQSAEKSSPARHYRSSPDLALGAGAKSYADSSCQDLEADQRASKVSTSGVVSAASAVDNTRLLATGPSNALNCLDIR